MATGTDTVDFGAFPGSLYTSKVITGQTGILAGSLIQAEIRAVVSADHLADEHLVDPPRVIAGDIVAGTGLTIHAFSNNTLMHHGVYNVFWVWS